MGKKNADKDRRARVEAMRKQQQSTERRRTLLVMGAALLVVVVLVAVVVAAIVNFRQDNPTELDAIGLSPAEASCGEVISEDTEGSGVHVGPGTDPPSDAITRVEYETAPPTSGRHFVSPEFPSQAFYTAEDRPAMETLVHNLEHGYTLVWYTEDLPAEQVEQLRRIADIARGEDATNGKFIVSAWDDSYGTFEDDATVALSHWGADQGHRQYCGEVSGEAIKSFIDEYPATNAPEPNAQ